MMLLYSRKAAIRSFASVAVGLLPIITAVAQTGVGPGPPDAGTVVYSQAPNAVVVTYHEELGELSSVDSTPRIRIFGNGRVAVHYPAFMKRAGTYEFQMGPAELRNLLRSLTAKGLVDFNARAVNNSRRARAVARRQERIAAGQPEEVFAISDETTTVIELNLDEYTAPGPSAPVINDVQKRVAWRNLRSDAERYSEIPAIQKLRAAEVELRGLLARRDLRKVE